MNQIYQQINQNNLNGVIQNISQIKKMFESPQALMQAISNTNPSLYGQLQNGANAKELFYEKAKRMGVDPETIINALK